MACKKRIDITHVSMTINISIKEHGTFFKMLYFIFPKLINVSVWNIPDVWPYIDLTKITTLKSQRSRSQGTLVLLYLQNGAIYNSCDSDKTIKHWANRETTSRKNM